MVGDGTIFNGATIQLSTVTCEKPSLQIAQRAPPAGTCRCWATARAAQPQACRPSCTSTASMTSPCLARPAYRACSATAEPTRCTGSRPATFASRCRRRRRCQVLCPNPVHIELQHQRATTRPGTHRAAWRPAPPRTRRPASDTTSAGCACA